MRDQIHSQRRRCPRCRCRARRAGVANLEVHHGCHMKMQRGLVRLRAHRNSHPERGLGTGVVQRGSVRPATIRRVERDPCLHQGQAWRQTTSHTTERSCSDRSRLPPREQLLEIRALFTPCEDRPTIHDSKSVRIARRDAHEMIRRRRERLLRRKPGPLRRMNLSGPAVVSAALGRSYARQNSSSWMLSGSRNVSIAFRVYDGSLIPECDTPTSSRCRDQVSRSARVETISSR